MNPRQQKRLSLALLIGIMLVNLLLVSPQLTVGRVRGNDTVAHFNMLHGMVNAVERGDNPLDFWSPETACGFSFFRTYQPLADGLVALLYFGLFKTVSLWTLFLLVQYVAIVSIPLSLFAMARLARAPWLLAGAAALLVPLIAAVGDGDMGIDYRSFLNYGLFPQAVATNLLLLALGFGYRAIREGRRPILAGVCLGLTALAQIIYGWMGALTLCLLIFIPAAESTWMVRLRRTVALGMVAMAVSVFELIPLFTDGYFMNHSIAEPATKWDSFGAVQVLSWLFTGQLMDVNRIPLMTLLGFAGAGLWIWQYRKTRQLEAYQMWWLAGALFWLLVFFGRSTWGPLLYLIGAAKDLHLHRVHAGFQLFMCLMGAGVLVVLWREVGRRSALGAAGLTALLLLPLWLERADVVGAYNSVGGKNLDAYTTESGRLLPAIELVKQRGGRTYSGMARTWGAAFQVGITEVYHILGLEQVPFIGEPHAYTALTSDVMMQFDELNPAHYRLYNVHTVLGPAMPGSPAFQKPIRDFGRFRVLEAPGDGYFGLVDVTAAAKVDRTTFFKLNEAWLKGDWFTHNQFIWLELKDQAPAGLERIPVPGPLPAAPAAPATEPGRVTGEKQSGQMYEADLDVSRACHALFRMTWHPNWVAYVDGVARKTEMLTPGFLGVPVEPGRHHIRLRYETSFWRLYLALAGFLLAGVAVVVEWRFTPPAPAEPDEVPAEAEPRPEAATGKRKRGKGK